MTPDQKAFIKHIEEDPTDEARHLVYADWLEENNQPEEADRQRKYTTARKYIEEIATSNGYTYTGIIRSAESAAEHINDIDTIYDEFPSNIAKILMSNDKTRQKFWESYTIVTGNQVYDWPVEPYDCGCGNEDDDEYNCGC